DTLRRSLEKSVEAYNSAVGSLERKVLPQARKFRDLGAGTVAEIGTLDAIDTTMRRLEVPEERATNSNPAPPEPPLPTHISDVQARIVGAPPVYIEHPHFPG
ncbi:MAG: hypothetical protein ABI035_09490, partial [Gemmatimonadaceae bacterium]